MNEFRRKIPANDLRQHGLAFRANRVITISNFIQSDLANRLLQFAELETVWNAYSEPPIWEDAGQQITSPDIRYRFYRTFDHAKDCLCPVCELQNAFNQDKILHTLLEYVTDQEVNSAYGFLSKYTSGCFLSTHTDKGNGKLAFVLNLTPFWHPLWGGCLHLVAPDWSTVEQVITPKFNALTVFDVTGEGRPHFVSPVAEHVPHARYAFSGWLR